MSENIASTATRLSNRIDNWIVNFADPPTEEMNDEVIELPLTTPLAEPDDIPEEVQVEPAKRQRKSWSRLPPRRVTRAMDRRLTATSIEAIGVRFRC